MSTLPQLMQQGYNELRAQKLDEAEALLRQALQLDARHSSAWCLLGMVLDAFKNRSEEAEAAYRRSLEYDPNNSIAYWNLANFCFVQNRYDECIGYYDEALRAEPRTMPAILNRAQALYCIERFDEGIRGMEHALSITPQDPDAHARLGIMLLSLGQWERGWKEYAWREKTSGFKYPKLAQPKWRGESLNGRTIALLSEQGFGDTIQFLRYGWRLKQRYDCRVVAVVPEKLIPLLKDCPGIDGVYPNYAQLPPFDVHALYLDVASILQDDFSSTDWPVPYIATTSELRDQYAAKFQGNTKRRVGLAWQGNRKHKADSLRSVPLKDMLPLAKLENTEFYSLQKGDGSEQLEPLREQFPIIDAASTLDDAGPAFLETAALMHQLEVTITVDTAIAHVAGALGLPVWLALNNVPDWRWGVRGERSTFYPTMRIFRRQLHEPWSELFARMARELEKTPAKI